MKPLFKLFLSIKSLSVFALVLLLSMSVNPVEAGKGKPMCPDLDDPRCDDRGGGDGGTMTLNPVDAWWSGEIGDSNVPPYRNCPITYGSTGNGGVNYECVKDPGVQVSLGSGTPGGSDGTDLCPLLTNLVLGGGPNGYDRKGNEIGNSRIAAYAFLMDPTWNDTPCTGVGSDCLVRMDIWAYFDNWCNNSKCGRLVIFNGWGKAEYDTGGDLNPFKNSQDYDVDDLTVTFKGIGKNKDVATCTYSGAEIGIEFHTRAH